MKRGSVITVALQGDFGKARPALVVQSSFFSEHPTVAFLQITGTITDTPLLRIDVEPTPANGLNKHSQIAVDKIFTVRVEKVGSVIGQIDDDTLLAVNRSMAVFYGIA